MDESTWKFTRSSTDFFLVKCSRSKELAADLKPYGYYKVPKTNGLWKHKSGPIFFTLVVNDFGVSYVDMVDTEHLKAALKAHYPIKVG